jgi:hypothetical protein
VKPLVPLVAVASLLASAPSHAGAWTLPEGQTQIITNITYSGASHSFTDSGAPTAATTFEKLWSSICAQYGLTDDLTLVVQPEYARAATAVGLGPAMHASDFAIGAGARYRLLDSFGVLSVQATIRSAGVFNMSVSADHTTGREAELRLLYGTNFSLFGHSGFADAEAGERFITGARPNETPIDLTLGIHITQHNVLMLQSFNIIAGGGAKPPYTYYRAHKLALSTVSGPWHGLSLQTGAFISPMGQNSLVETGVFAAIWAQF